MARAPFQVLVFPYRPRGNGEYEYALLKRADKSYWQPVAGGGEQGESILQAAQRETFEETGIPPEAPFLQLQTIEPIPVTEFKDSHLWGEDTYVIPQYCFGVLAPGQEIKLSPEHTLCRWLTFPEAYPLLKFDGNRTALWELEQRLRGTGPRGQTQPIIAHPSAQPLTLLKLGGSLITDKTKPHTPRPATLQRLANEIAAARTQQPDTRLVLGHGSGSFGHVPAKKYGTRHGVHTPEEWHGFQEVWYAASSLNHIVVEALHAAGLPAIAFPPSAVVTAQAGKVWQWNLDPLETALANGLLPVVYGDAVIDIAWGGTILSTEDLFSHLANHLTPDRLLLAGLEEGVYEDYPACSRLIPKISSQTLLQQKIILGGSAGSDVTGGMESKVRQTLALLEEVPGLEAWIFSGETPGHVQQALLGASLGTHLTR